MLEVVAAGLGPMVPGKLNLLTAWRGRVPQGWSLTSAH